MLFIGKSDLQEPFKALMPFLISKMAWLTFFIKSQPQVAVEIFKYSVNILYYRKPNLLARVRLMVINTMR